MKTLAKIVGVLFLAGLLCVACLIAFIEFLHSRSQREVVATVHQLAPGTLFSSAVQRFGQPKQIFTNAEEIVWWLKQNARNGARPDERFTTNAILHTFVHYGPPLRYILVYTDRDSQRILHADWCQM